MNCCLQNINEMNEWITKWMTNEKVLKEGNVWMNSYVVKKICYPSNQVTLLSCSIGILVKSLIQVLWENWNISGIKHLISLRLPLLIPFLFCVVHSRGRLIVQDTHSFASNYVFLMYTSTLLITLYVYKWV